MAFADVRQLEHSTFRALARVPIARLLHRSQWPRSIGRRGPLHCTIPSMGMVHSHFINAQVGLEPIRDACVALHVRSRIQLREEIDQGAWNLLEVYFKNHWRTQRRALANAARFGCLGRVVLRLIRNVDDGACVFLFLCAALVNRDRLYGGRASRQLRRSTNGADNISDARLAASDCCPPCRTRLLELGPFRGLGFYRRVPLILPNVERPKH